MLDKNVLATNLLLFFKSMNGGTNQQFASDFADKIDQWYCSTSGTTVDGGTISSGAFLGSGTVSKVNGQPNVLSTSILSACTIIDSTKPNNAKELFANSLSNGYVLYTKASIIECNVNGTVTSGGSASPMSGTSKGIITLYNDPTEISIEDYTCDVCENILLSPNLTKGSIEVKYTYDEQDFTSVDDKEGNINGDYVHGTVDYSNGKISLYVDEEFAQDITTCKVSYKFTSDFYGDVLRLINELDVQGNESQAEYMTRLGGDSDKYFADNLADILYTQTTSVLLMTIGNESLLGSVGIGKLF